MKILFILIVSLVISMASDEVLAVEWEVKSVYDGDTVNVYIPNMPKEMAGLNWKIRILGIDTPEKGHRAKCDLELHLGNRATHELKRLIKDRGGVISVYNLKHDKYGGRILADVFVGGLDVAKHLISKGLARPYFGKKKSSWCD
ncbi:hypothetical protein LCGC14_1776130 [marine sediment metagenome]|uniref:TNase-like domain-containing protein n=1 Tax=marine sediment metagenome TaxID=412755 RepID=A0A0F9JBS7_9ZZZZ|nr:thermonuclease family protein [Candidatus Scalindua sp.]